jgi:hypothetical protein
MYRPQVLSDHSMVNHASALTESERKVAIVIYWSRQAGFGFRAITRTLMEVRGVDLTPRGAEVLLKRYIEQTTADERANDERSIYENLPAFRV